jgi:hypothetical protein
MSSSTEEHFMSRATSMHRSVFASLALVTLSAAWWGCSPTPGTGTGTTTTSASSSSGAGGSSTSSGGTGGTGGIDVMTVGSGGDDSGACSTTSATAHPVQLDMIFLIDRSGSLSGPKWVGTSVALSTFFNDPASANIGVGILYFPNEKPFSCILEDYKTLSVPINTLPANAFPLTNSLPADANGAGTPIYGVLKGSLMIATAYQDAHPKHKVVVVLATDGEPNSCGMTTVDNIASLAKSALNYNGVRTFVIGAEGSVITNLNKIAAGGGTTAAYDITNDINDFSAKIKEIRSQALACEFDIPPPPDGKDLEPGKVNFTYTPKGIGMPKTLLRAEDLADCGGKPGWYYDSNLKPTKVILCPASCSTVEADLNAKVEVLFGCTSQVN